MNEQILGKLTKQELQNYMRTLKKRINQLRVFNNELIDDNNNIIARIEGVKAQILDTENTIKIRRLGGGNRKIGSLSPNNMNFDDLYKVGIKKVGEFVKDKGQGVKTLLSAGENKLKKGMNILKSYISKPKSQPTVTSNQNNQEVVNEQADFNSYNVGDGRFFVQLQPAAEYDLDQKHLQNQVEGKSDSKAEQGSESVNSKAVGRRKIFEKVDQQPPNKNEQNIQQQIKPNSIKTTDKNGNRAQTNLQQIQQKKQENNEYGQIKNNKQESSQLKQQTDNEKSTGVKKQLKEITVELNQVVDLEQHSDDEEREDHHRVCRDQVHEEHIQIFEKNGEQQHNQNKQIKQVEKAKPSL